MNLVALAAALAVAAPASGDDAAALRRVGALLDYVSVDYPPAVDGGADGGNVVDEAELREEDGFLRDAAAGLRALPAASALDTRLAAALDALAAKVAAGTPADAVVAEARTLREALIKDAGLSFGPKAMPDAARGAALYAQACAACHAPNGSGHTELALTTKPPDFTQGERRAELSPERIFGAVSYGVPGTDMPSYAESLDDGERWDLAFWLLALADAPPALDASRGAAALTARGGATTLSALASKTDAQLAAWARGLGVAAGDVSAVLAHLRGVAPYRPAESAPLAVVRGAVADAVRAYDPAAPAAARVAVLSAYLDDFEPHEARLRASRPALVSSLESAFATLRSTIEGGAAPADVRADAARLDALLADAEAASRTGGAGVAFFAALAIALREGLEAALLVAALLALAKKLSGPAAARAVLAGLGAALAAGGLLWAASGALLQRGSGTQREVVEGVVQLATALLLLTAARWLIARDNLRHMLDRMAARSRLAAGGVLAIGGVAFVAVFREAFEVVVFYRGLLMESPGLDRPVGMGALVGCALLGGVVFGLSRVGYKLKPRPLLVGSSALLGALAIVMTGEAIRSLQEAAAIPLSPLGSFSIPALGVYATWQGLGAQGLVVALVAAGAVKLAVHRQHAHPRSRAAL